MVLCVSKGTPTMLERRRGQSPSCQIFQEDLAKAHASVSTLQNSLQAVLAALQTQNKLLAGVIFALAAETAIGAAPLSTLATPLQPLYELAQSSGGGLSSLASFDAAAISRPSGNPLP